MNKGKKTMLQNLENVRSHVDETLGFFGRWHAVHDAAPAAERCKEEKDCDLKINMPFLSKMTCINIQTAIDSFLEHASLVLNNPDGPQCVPFLHSNSGVLEALFLQMRSLNCGTPEKHILDIWKLFRDSQIKPPKGAMVIPQQRGK
jgi:hypothetical protein